MGIRDRPSSCPLTASTPAFIKPRGSSTSRARATQRILLAARPFRFGHTRQTQALLFAASLDRPAMWPLFIVYGTQRVSVNLLEGFNFTGSAAGGKGGKGLGQSGGKKGSNQNYAVDVAFGLCQGPVNIATGAPLGVQIATDLHLDAGQRGLMVAVPLLSGALLRVVNGFLVDARFLKREIQEEALRKGLIPYIPERPQRLKDDEDDEE